MRLLPHQPLAATRAGSLVPHPPAHTPTTAQRVAPRVCMRAAGRADACKAVTAVTLFNRPRTLNLSISRSIVFLASRSCFLSLMSLLALHVLICSEPPDRAATSASSYHAQQGGAPGDAHG